MDGMLSQEEINALLSSAESDADLIENTINSPKTEGKQILTDAEKDVLGEISNISMGSSATALFSLLNQRVNITTPKVSYTTWDDLLVNYDLPCVFVQIYYKDGIDGNNIFIMKENDVKIIADLMMGGDGTNVDAEMSEMHLSAISEAMNQMMGAAATSLSSILDTRIDISPPTASLVDPATVLRGEEIADFLKGEFVKVLFQLEVGDLINSELMQLYPFEFAKVLHDKFLKYAGLDTMDEFGLDTEEKKANKEPEPEPVKAMPKPEPVPQAPQPVQNNQQMQQQGQQPVAYMMPPVQDVNISPVQFQQFIPQPSPLLQTENIDLLLDVPLEVTAELGRTSKSIKEILDFSPGTIIELNRLAGEPIDVLVNGKYVAKGEVVVIEETFGIRVTDIIK